MAKSGPVTQVDAEDADRRMERPWLPDLVRKDWTRCPITCRDRTLNQRAAVAILVGRRRPLFFVASAT